MHQGFRAIDAEPVEDRPREERLARAPVVRPHHRAKRPEAHPVGAAFVAEKGTPAAGARLAAPAIDAVRRRSRSDDEHATEALARSRDESDGRVVSDEVLPSDPEPSEDPLHGAEIPLAPGPGHPDAEGVGAPDLLSHEHLARERGESELYFVLAEELEVQAVAPRFREHGPRFVSEKALRLGRPGVDPDNRHDLSSSLESPPSLVKSHGWDPLAQPDLTSEKSLW